MSYKRSTNNTKPSVSQLKELYSQGVNISEYLRDARGIEQNTPETIEISYDLQAGSYTAAMKNPEYAARKRDYFTHLADIILSLCRPGSILEAGVGEATTLRGLLERLGYPVASYGFDLSWSRLAFARAWLEAGDIANAVLCTGDLMRIPFSDNAIDVVYTSHSIEPNGGMELPILKELYRVARRFLVLVEPSYELAHESARKRMELHGYCRGILESARSLGFDVLKHERFPVVMNVENPVAVTIIRKEASAELPASLFACPITGLPLREEAGAYYSKDALFAYPIIGGVPCLRESNAILASRYLDSISGNVSV